MWTPDLTGRGPVKYLAIVEALSQDIADGRLRAGDRLPTHRDLAWRLGVNVSTVSNAYREAARRHLIGGEVGRGTYVLAESREVTLFQLKAVEAASVIDLTTNVPAERADDDDLTAAMAALMADGAGRRALGYHAPALMTRAQAAAADWLAWRGLPTRPNRVVPCAGAQQALLATLLALAGPDATLLVEEHTFPGMKAVARQLRLRLHAVAMDGEGVVPEALERAVHASGARIAVMVPTLQNPTGAVMSRDRCRAIADIARRTGMTVVEDDVYGAIADVPPLAAVAPDHTVVVGSLSKTVAAGLRFGFIAGPPDLMTAIGAEVHATNWPMSPLMAELACRWLEDGTARRRAAWQRDEVSARWRMAVAALGLAGQNPLPPAGPHLWVPVQGRPGDAVARARAAGVEIVASEVFAVGRDFARHVRISLAAARSRSELSRAIARLDAAGIFTQGGDGPVDVPADGAPRA